MHQILLRVLLASCLLAGVAFGQQGGGAIFGAVTDQQDAVVGGATVIVTHVNTGSVFRTQTNDSGNYSAPNLAIGQYEVAVEMEGFKRAVRSGLTLQVNQRAQVDVVLELGQIVETVEVVGAAPLVDTGSATLGQVIENRRVQELPLNGRQALALTLLTAGVVANNSPTASGFGDRGIQLSSISINGSPNSMNNQMLDGNNNTLSYVGEVGVPPAVDAVEEFKVQSGAMSAEFGFTAGGAINLVTKSGTNEFHGTGYWFLRNDKLDARNTYASTKLPLRYNQYGASLGGPAIKNKLFGFFNFEQYLLRQSSPRISSTPIDPWRKGDFSDLRDAAGKPIIIYDPATTRPNPAGAGLVRDPLAGNIVPSNRFDPITPKILAFWPKPNATPNNPYTNAQNYRDASLNRVDWTQFSGKADYRINDRNSMFVRYSQAEHDVSGNSIFLDPTVGPDRSDNQLNRNAVVSDTHTFSPTLINSLRVGISRQFFTFRAVNGGKNWPSRLGLPSIIPDDQFPNINFGFGQIGGQAFGTRTSLNWDIQNMVTKIAGNHTLKMGANYRILYGGNQQGNGLSGTYSFSGLTTNPQKTAGTGYNLAQFLLGEVDSANIQRISGNSWHGDAWSFFLQDDWKVNRKLTLNLGLRYDYQQKPYERNNGHINFDPTRNDPATGLPGIVVYAGRDGQPRSFLDEDYNDLGPRFGFAYDVFGTGKLVARGGYGIYYPSIFFRAFLGDTTFFSTSTTQYTAQGPGQRAFLFAQGPPFAPVGLPGASAGPGARLGQSIGWTESDSTTPLTQQWNFSLQTQIRDWMVDATYAGNKGNHFIASGYNLNQIEPAIRFQLKQSLSDSVANPCAGLVPGGLGAAKTTRERTLMAYPCYSSVSVRNPRLGNYLSHQLQLTVQRRMSHGLLVNFAYTAGKRISDSELVPVDWNLENSQDSGFQDGLYNRKVNRSLDPADVAQRGVISLLYELPMGPGKALNPNNPALNKIVGGWQVNTIGLMQTGVPLRIRGASNFQANRPNSTGQSAKLDNPTRERWFDTMAFVNPPDFTFGNVGRTLPDVRSPGTVNWDLSLIKNTQITERVNVQFRAEAFNFLNHVNLRLPNTSFSAGADGFNRSSTFGTISSARDARILQFGLKVLF